MLLPLPFETEKSWSAKSEDLVPSQKFGSAAGNALTL